MKRVVVQFEFTHLLGVRRLDAALLARGARPYEKRLRR
jgi:hypothetical protein